MLTDIDNSYLAMLKEYWIKEGVQNAIGRDSRLLPKFDIIRVVGKEQCIAINSGFGGAISGDYTKALANIASQGDVQAFHYTPGRMFSLYKVSPAEYEVSKNYDGATMKLEGVKHGVSLQRMRKALSGAIYSRGYGELCVIGVTTALSTSADTTYTVPFNVYMQITTGTKLAFKATVDGAEAATMTVTSKVTYTGGTTGDITVRGDSAYTPAATDILAFAGATVLSSGNQVPRWPVGLGGAFPTVAGRSGATWTSFIGNTYYGVNRSRDVNGLAGTFIDDRANASATYKSTVKKALLVGDANGSKADLLVLNSFDWDALSNEIEASSLYYSNVKDGGGKRKAGIGISDIDVNFYTTIVERVVADPFCPKGTFYLLDSEQIKFLSFFDADPYLKNTKDNSEEPGKVMNLDEMEGANKNSVEEPYAALIDGYLSSEPSHDMDGTVCIIAFNLRATWACLNPSVNIVGHFKSAADDNDVEFSA